jgi:hypothetical protein
MFVLSLNLEQRSGSGLLALGGGTFSGLTDRPNHLNATLFEDDDRL